MSRVGKRIKEERVKKGISPKQLGQKCGVAESYIIDIESGKKIINDKLISQISKILGVNLDDNIIDEAPKQQENTQTSNAKVQSKLSPIKRTEVEPLPQWELAFSNIIKEVPIFNIELTNIKGHKSFPIIDKKVEGYNPDKLIYVEAPDDSLNQYRIHKGDRCLIYLNQEIVNGSFQLVEFDKTKSIKKIKRIDGSNIQLIDGIKNEKSVVKNSKDIKILGKVIRIEIDLIK